jgi:hypothetical protein
VKKKVTVSKKEWTKIHKGDKPCEMYTSPPLSNCNILGILMLDKMQSKASATSFVVLCLISKTYPNFEQ